MHCLFITCYSKKIQAGCIHPGHLIDRQSGKLYHIDSALDECDQTTYIKHAFAEQEKLPLICSQAWPGISKGPVGIIS